MSRSAGDRRLLRWLLAAALLHAFLIPLALRSRPVANAVPASRPAAVEFEAELLSPEAPQVAETKVAEAQPTPAPLVRAEQAARVAVRAARLNPQGTATASESASAPTVAQAGSDDNALPLPAAAAPTLLSRDQLGIGASNPFVTREAPAEPSVREQGRLRFQKALAGELARADQSAGLGPEGPVLVELEQATRNDNPEPNSTAVFDFTTDAEGRLLSVELVRASSVEEPWRRIRDRVLAALRARPLRIPKTGFGVSFRIRVVSRVQMPSGADPGLAVSVAGIPVKKGRGPRSASIDVLQLVPKVSTSYVDLPNGHTVLVPKVEGLRILSVNFDPADIGAKEQRMVRAHLERLTVNDKPRQK